VLGYRQQVEHREHPADRHEQDRLRVQCCGQDGPAEGAEDTQRDHRYPAAQAGTPSTVLPVELALRGRAGNAPEDLTIVTQTLRCISAPLRTNGSRFAPIPVGHRNFAEYRPSYCVAAAGWRVARRR
jgi:hypothetical protein